MNKNFSERISNLFNFSYSYIDAIRGRNKTILKLDEDDRVNLIIQFWDHPGKFPSTYNGYIDWLKSNGFDSSGYSDKMMNADWDKASEK